MTHIFHQYVSIFFASISSVLYIAKLRQSHRNVQCLCLIVHKGLCDMPRTVFICTVKTIMQGHASFASFRKLSRPKPHPLSLPRSRPHSESLFLSSPLSLALYLSCPLSYSLALYTHPPSHPLTLTPPLSPPSLSLSLSPSLSLSLSLSLSRFKNYIALQ